MNKLYPLIILCFFCVAIDASNVSRERSISQDTISVNSAHSTEEQNHDTITYTLPVPRTIEIRATIPHQQMQRYENEERLSCCQVLQQVAETYQNDINAYGPCCYCGHFQSLSIRNQQVSHFRRRIDTCMVYSCLVIRCFPCIVLETCCNGIDYCCTIHTNQNQ